MAMEDRQNRHELSCVTDVPEGRHLSPTQEPPPTTILAINSDHGLSFAGEETRTMV